MQNNNFRFFVCIIYYGQYLRDPLDFPEYVKMQSCFQTGYWTLDDSVVFIL